jgi:hypothetical protein
MAGLFSYWRLRRQLWQIECAEQAVLFRERHRVSIVVLALLYVGAGGLAALMALPTLAGSDSSDPAIWNRFLLFSNGFALIFTAFVVLSVRNTVITVDPAHLHVGWRGIHLQDMTQWQRTNGATTRAWRRKLLKPMGRSALSIGLWAATGGVASVFCPLWMRTGLLIELRGLDEPEYVLVGTRRPEEFEAALVQATSKLKPRQMDLSWLDDLKP